MAYSSVFGVNHLCSVYSLNKKQVMLVSFHVEISIFWISSIRSFTLARLVDTLVIGLLMINDNFIFLDTTKLKDFANILSCSFSLFVDISIMGYDYKDRIKL